MASKHIERVACRACKPTRPSGADWPELVQVGGKRYCLACGHGYGSAANGVYRQITPDELRRIQRAFAQALAGQGVLL